jgi:thiamine-phosphate pyrophosphorylase
MIALPRLYPILDAGFFSDADALVAAATELAAAGCTLLQYRNKSGNARVMLEQARALRRRLTGLSLRHPERSRFSGGARDLARGEDGRAAREIPRPAGASAGLRDDASEKETSQVQIDGVRIRLIMNDRADLCLAADFDGVHVGQDDLSPESVRRIISPREGGPERWLGVSTHNPEQLREADLTSADYLAIGPVFATSSKEKPDPVVGLEGVRRARALTRKPLVAIGGITRANAASVIEAGADSVAVISDLLRDPGKSAEEFLRILR